MAPMSHGEAIILFYLFVYLLMAMATPLCGKLIYAPNAKGRLAEPKNSITVLFYLLCLPIVAMYRMYSALRIHISTDIVW